MFAERFSFVAELGAGSFGCVRKMMDNLATPPRLVAVKTLAQPAETWEHAVKLREVQLLMRLSHPGHPNIVRLEQVLREGAVVHLVFEYLSQSLYSRLRQGLAASQVRNICYQILQGLAHMHGCGVAHRDIKPENVLFDLNHTVKICDLGLARLTNDEPPFTSYHATRWYRAPELLLGATRYNCAVDMWAFGCIMPELYTGRPLFPGTSELNQLVTICTVKASNLCFPVFAPYSEPANSTGHYQRGQLAGRHGAGAQNAHSSAAPRAADVAGHLPRRESGGSAAHGGCSGVRSCPQSHGKAGPLLSPI